MSAAAIAAGFSCVGSSDSRRLCSSSLLACGCLGVRPLVGGWLHSALARSSKAYLGH
jgi:hypothetical protein